MSILAREDYTQVSCDIGVANACLFVARSRYTARIKDKSRIQPMKSRLQLSEHLRGIERLPALPERPKRKRGELAPDLRYEHGSGKSVPFEILFWERFSIMEGDQGMSNYVALVKNMCVALHKKLEPFLKTNSIDDVVIESQEASSLDIIKSLGASVQAFFETLKLECKYDYNVRLSTGTIKLRVYDGPVCWKEPVKAPDGHKFNKRYGIHHCRAILEAWCKDPVYGDEFKPWLKYFESEDKQDDLSDALLQALYGLRLWQNHKVSAELKAPVFVPAINSSARKPSGVSAWQAHKDSRAGLLSEETCQV